MTLQARKTQADTIAASAGMKQRLIPAGEFTLTAYEHVHAPGQPAMIYIEGDGLAWLDRHTPSLDPTPTMPLALALAAQDKAENVVYLARPCQYNRMLDAACDVKDWTQERFSRRIVASMNAAIDAIQQRTGFTKINLIGYSGGGAITVLLAAQRHDVVSLRTVAGNLDIAAFARIHDVSPLSGSLNPLDVAGQVAHLPQIHFVGADDTVIPLAIAQSFSKASDTSCSKTRVISHATHEQGWTKLWPALLQDQPDCKNISYVAKPL